MLLILNCNKILSSICGNDMATNNLYQFQVEVVFSIPISISCCILIPISISCCIFNSNFNFKLYFQVIGIGLRGFLFLQFCKALYLLQIPFSCVSANCSLRGIVRDPFTTFNFPVSFFFFFKLVCISFCFLSMS